MTFTKFSEEMKPFFNDICLAYGTELVRLIGVSSDAMDYYYVYKDCKGRVFHGTAVGHMESLKGKIKSYPHVENLFNLYGVGPNEHWLEYDEPENDGLCKQETCDE